MTKTALFPRKKTPLRQFSQLAERGGLCIWCFTMLNLLVLASFLAVGAAFQAALASDQEQFHVGVQPDGRIVVPTNQILQPAGTQITFPGRPVSLLLIDRGKTLVVQNKNNLVFIDVPGRKVKQTLPSKVGLSVIGLAGNDTHIYTSDAKDHVQVIERQADGAFKLTLVAPLAKPKVDGAA